MQFEAAYRRYRSPVLAWLQSRNTYGIDAEDAVQETFLQAWRIWDRADGIDNLRNWLIGIAKRVVGHMYRAMRLRPEGNAVEWDIERDERLVQPAQGLALYVEQLRRHFQGLGPAQCAVLNGLADGESPPEIAARSATSLSATSMAISLGRRRLRERLSEKHI